MMQLLEVQAANAASQPVLSALQGLFAALERRKQGAAAPVEGSARAAVDPRALRHALAVPEVVARLADVGAEPALLEGAAFGQFIDAQRSLMTGLADAAGMKPE